MKKYLCIYVALCVVVLCCSFISGCAKGTSKEIASAERNLPWENHGKQPSEYTWEEFEGLDGSLRVAFQQSFGSMEAFNQWMKEAKGVNTQSTNPEGGEHYDLELPWENDGKQPSEYTWAEFLALDGSQQIAFQQSFDSVEAFERWVQMAKPELPQNTEQEETISLELPWEHGGKQPSEYTWTEFQALDGDLQIAFQQSFNSAEPFEAWLNCVSAGSTEPTDDEENVLYIPWEHGGKQPSEYTWAEFQALDGDLQIAFQQSFNSAEPFEAWLNRVSGESTEPTDDEENVLYLPWEHGGKQPSEYTWAEFQALDGDLQIAFQQSFNSEEPFEAWLNRVSGGSTEPAADDEENALYLPWEHGGKQPSEYTWEEFEALDGGLQIAFQQSFGSIEIFDEWLQRVNPQ